MLKVMAANEGVEVTTDLTNKFVAGVHSLCDDNPTELWGLEASAAFASAVQNN